MSQKVCFFCIIPVILLFFSGCQNESFEPDKFQLNSELFSGEQSQGELNRKALEEYTRAEKNLNRMYTLILDKYRSNRELVDNLRKAQEAWNEYREFHLKSIFPGPEFTWGSAYTMSYNIEKANITWLRVKELYKWVAPGNAGETVPDPWHGSYGMFKQSVAQEQ